MTLYNYDAHLAEEDEQLFDHHARSWRKKSERAALDLERDLKAMSYLTDRDHSLIDDFQKATAQVAFAASGGQLTVPAGTRIVALDPDSTQVVDDISRAARVVFVTDAGLVVEDGETGTVGVTAEHPGVPYNVEAGWLTALEDTAPANFASVTNAAAATGGQDHQLTRAAVYRAMELIHFDLMRMTDDAFDARRRIYGAEYKAELKRIKAAGLQVDTDGDGAVSEEEEQLFGGGGISLSRS